MSDLEAGGTEPPLHVFGTRVWFDELDKVGELDVELRVVKIGTTSCVYEFRFVGDGGVVHAVGRRTIVRTGPDRRPVPWSEEFRRVHERGVE